MSNPRNHRELLRHHLQKPSVRYILVGGSAYVLELAVIVIAQHGGLSSIWAVALSFWIGLVYSFTLQKFVSFKDKRTHSKVLLPQIALVSLLVLFNFSFTIALTDILKHTLPTVVIRTLAIGATTIWNFYLYKTRIFNAPVID